MKGIFSSTHATHSIDIEGERWRQGDILKLKVESTPIEDSFDKWHITIAFADLKKLKKNNDNSAFTIIKQLPLVSKETNISLALAEDSPITDGQFSLMVICGDKDSLATASRLELTVEHHKMLEDYIKTLELFHRLQLKTFKNKKNSLDAKFTLPKTREYGAIEQLNIIMSYKDSALKSKCIFKVKKLEYTGSGVEAKVTKIEEDTQYTAENLTSFGSFNQEIVKTKMSETLERVKTRTLI